MSGWRKDENFFLYVYKTVKCDDHSAVDAGIQRKCFKYHHAFERRRNPLDCDYSWIFCPAVNPTSQSKMSAFNEPKYCPKGDSCDKSHTIFENWYHPHLFRTELCYRGADCRSGTQCSYAHKKSKLRSATMAVISHYEKRKKHLQTHKSRNRPGRSEKPAACGESETKAVVKDDLVQNVFQRRKDYEETLSQVSKPSLESKSPDLAKTIFCLAKELKSQKSAKTDKTRVLKENKIVLRKDPDADQMVVKFENPRLKKLRSDLALVVDRVKSFDEGDCKSIISDRFLSDQLSELDLENAGCTSEITKIAAQLKNEIEDETLSLLSFTTSFLKALTEKTLEKVGSPKPGETSLNDVAKRLSDAQVLIDVEAACAGGDPKILRDMNTFYFQQNKAIMREIACLGCKGRVMNRVFVPCGHVFCDVCVNRMVQKKCPLCTKKIASIKNIYVFCVFKRSVFKNGCFFL